MILTLVKRNFMLSDYGNYYFEDEDGETYYWYTNSDKIYENVEVGDRIEVTSYKTDGVWVDDGIEIQTIKNVRFKLTKIRIK